MSYVHPFAIPLSVTGEPLFRGYRGYVRRLTGRVSCSDTRRCVGMIFNIGTRLSFGRWMPFAGRCYRLLWRRAMTGVALWVLCENGN
jgi:hypothetical protein